jgi:hypothetical protein
MTGRVQMTGIYEKIAAMIAAGQLMRLAMYAAGFTSSLRGASRTPAFFKCGLLEDQTPMPTHHLYDLEKRLAACV